MAHESKPDVIGLTETWLHDGRDSSELAIPNYVLFRKDRVENNRRHGSTHNGGVILYFKSNLNVTRVDLNNVESPYNRNIWVKISIPFTRPIYVCVTYKHP